MSEQATGVDQFTDPNFVLHEVEFRVTKLNPRAGIAAVEYIRPELAKVKSHADGGLAGVFDGLGLEGTSIKGLPQEAIVLGLRIANMVLSLEPALIQRLENDLFGQVRFLDRKHGQKEFLTLAGNLDQAMAGMPFVCYYLILGRAFMVNFIDSFEEIRSLIDGLGL